MALLALLAVGAVAGDKYVAVVETEIDMEKADAAKLKKSEVRLITDELREKAVNTLPRGYNVMTSETVMTQSGAVLSECAEENCIITLGSKIGADYIVRGKLGKVGTLFTLSAVIYDTEDGFLVASSKGIRAEKMTELLEKAGAACEEMYKKFVSERASTSTPAPKPEPPAPAPATYTVTAATNPAYGGGTVSLNPSKASYNAGEKVTITAVPAGGYMFTGWSGGVKGTENPMVITVNGDLAFAANFQYRQQPLAAPTTNQPSIAAGTNAPARQSSTTFTGGSRDGKTYKTVVIGGKTWMAENLNVATEGSWCYDNKESNCEKYGRLYNWSAAKRACPGGWHLPLREEWGDLAKAAGGSGKYGTGGKAGRNLKTKSGWNNNGNGTDDYGFSALPGGFYIGGFGIGGFGNAGDYGYWWTATENGSDNAYNRYMDYVNEGVIEHWDIKNFGHSVRCLQD
jgi:uncharacterized protein (TIGR02145 family)